MTAELRSWWQRIKQHPVRLAVSIGAGLLGIALLVAFIGGYFFNWDWTGFSSYTPPVKDSNFQRGKTLWDWLNLLGVLAIPAVVGLGAAWYTAQQGKVSDRENTDNQRETALQTYIDKMSELLLHEKLRDSAEEDEVRNVARVRTLTVLLRLDANRKSNVLQFLYESGLINKDESIIDLRTVRLRASDLDRVIPRGAYLSGADLSGADLRGADLHGAFFRKADLSGADLSGADLRRADLREADLGAVKLCAADLSGAYLWETDLSGTDLRGADLSGTDLRGADLKGAYLWEADLRGADLSGADLRRANLDGANLSFAKVTQEELDQAKSFKNATMPDGSKHS